MVLTNPQWLGVRELIQSGQYGALRSISGFFSYFNRDPQNVRNQQAIGGGALMDIGCYPVTLHVSIFGAEPRKVLGLIERDPGFGTDRLTSAMLDFGSGQSTFTCSTQLVPHQRMQCFGTDGQIEIEIPFNAPADRPARVLIIDRGGQKETMEFPAGNQYTIQGDRFSQSIREQTSQPIALEEAVKNMAVIDAVFRSAESGCWEVL